MFWLKTRYYSQKGKKSARRALYYRCYLHFFRHLDLMPLLMETAPEREWCRKTAAKPGRELTTDLGPTQERTGSATWATTGQAAWLLPHEVRQDTNWPTYGFIWFMWLYMIQTNEHKK